MRTHTAISALFATGLLLTACGSRDSDKAAEPSASATATTVTPTVEEPASPEDAAKEADEDFQKTLDDLENALGETIGVHPGTYEVTNSQPEYDDPSLALDDEYVVPGTYTTKGSADGSSSCYWSRMRDASGQSGAIIANDLTAGRAIVELGEGEFFKTSGCKPWTHSGD
ncbi:hypothetical protein ABZ835_48335 [Streptomyces sp. NPDC047461]|uniref:hypothetical protein n=1 Tax=Streptomyces sp. NPDC047461 TaxID=3155619 RepID=UPI0033C7E3D8